MAKNDHRGAGAKHDTGKPCVHSVLRYFPRALEALARVNEYGASNHGWDTWDSIEDAKGRYDDARLRHDLDDAKVAVLELMLRERGKRQTRKAGCCMLPIGPGAIEPENG